jgi:AcrR family transcriptional regulator
MAARGRGRKLKQDRAVETRGEILSAAITFFAQRGIANTTVVQLAKSIGMTPGALYWHFPSKEDLLLAATGELHRRLLEAFGSLVLEARAKTARDQLLLFLERINAFLADKPEYGAFFSLVSAEASGTNELVASALRSAMATYVEAVAGIVRYGQKKGEFRKDLDAQTVAHGLIGAHSGLLIHTQLFKAARYGEVGHAIDTLVLDALAAKPKR